MMMPKDFNVELSIHVDDSGELVPYMEQEYISVPVRYPCISVPLGDTEGLISLADKVRAEAGKVPLWDQTITGEIDTEGWYDFSIDLQRNPLDERVLFPRVYFRTIFSNSDDNEVLYMIDIPDALYDRFVNRVLDEIAKWMPEVDLEKIFDDTVEDDLRVEELRQKGEWF